MPSQASLGAGVLQTAMRLSISLGLAITTAVYGTTSQSPKDINDVDFPYERAYLCTIIFAVIGFLFIPFMRIGKQDGKTELEKDEAVIDIRPRTGGEYSDGGSGGHNSAQHYHHRYDDQHGHHFTGNSTLTVNTMATIGSQVSFFPRWSWEDRDHWSDKRPRESNIVYEVCVKCLEERRVIVQENWDHDIVRRYLSDKRHSTNEPEDFERHGIQLANETMPPRLESEAERVWTLLRKERIQMRREHEEVDRVWARLPDERNTQPRRQVERAWQRFPVKPSTRDVERCDVSRGGEGWL